MELLNYSSEESESEPNREGARLEDLDSAISTAKNKNKKKKKIKLEVPSFCKKSEVSFILL